MKGYKYEGQKFGEWEVLKGLGKGVYLARCSCGKTKEVHISNLTRGLSTNCGCIQRKVLSEKSKTHGMTNTSIYKVWRGIINRCENNTVYCYKDYGGRGIKVCNEWHKFENFYEWAKSNGYTKGLEIDRINFNGDYEPNNCRWVTRKENANNKRNTRFITIKGVTKPETVWEEENGLRKGLIRQRIALGWEEKDWLNKSSSERNGRFKPILIDINGEKLTFKEISKRYGLTVNCLQARYSKGDRGERLIRKPEPRNKKRSEW